MIGYGEALPWAHEGSAEPHVAETQHASEAELWRRLREQDDAGARAELLRRHLPYAKVVAAVYYRRRHHEEVEFDDYLQLARLGMVEAMERYDAGKGAAFRTFAARRMHGAILDGLDQLTERQRQIAFQRDLRAERIASLKQRESGQAPGGLSIAAASTAGDLLRQLADIGLGLALAFMLEDTGMWGGADGEAAAHPQASYQGLELRQLRSQVHDLVDKLPGPQRRVIRDHYFQQVPFESIAKALQVTKGRVAQLHKQALETLRELSAARPRCDVAF